MPIPAVGQHTEQILGAAADRRSNAIVASTNE
jgi:hypothetical protein